MKYLLLILTFVGIMSIDAMAIDRPRKLSADTVASGNLTEKVTKTTISNPTPPPQKEEKLLPGTIPTFWFTFVVSLIGAYFIYSLVLGPLAVLLIYFLANKRKKEVMKAVWGWIAGTVSGILLWLIFKGKVF